MAESVVFFAVERLGDLLIQEGKFLFGVSNQIKEMQEELRRMQCFLKDADARQDGDERVQNWVAEIRDLAYRTEDVVESYAFKVASKKEGKRGTKMFMGRFACIFNEGVSLYKVGLEIKSIKKKINKLTTSLRTYGIKAISQEETSSSASDKQRWLRISYSHIIEEDFVGMEDDVEQLVSRLVSFDKECGIISIKGMGGQGKTTIATKIFNREDVRSSFEGFAWTCVTQQCEPKNIFQDILRELIPEINVRRMGDRELVKKLHNVQQEKKCLVVLDDIWSISDWESLKSAFPIGGKAGSKILLTTRKLEVAKVGFIHELRCLDPDKGWELLQKKAFPKRDNTLDFEVDQEKEKIGREMVQKCGGLPLAISVLGGILKGKSSSRDWEMVNKDIESYLSTGEGIEEGDQAVTQVLGLSYNDLPCRLKPCFMHLGFFGEDSTIDAWKLYRLWMAEGLLSSKDQRKGETMTDVAERYLGELAQRSMVRVELVDESIWSISTGRFRSCRLHDLMRDLCLSKGKKKDFLKIIDSQSHGNEFAAFMTSSTSKTRRLAIHSGEDQDGDVYIPDEEHQPTRNLRSLMFFRKSELGNSLISGIKEFKFLRVLDFGGVGFGDNSLPQGISKLIHLRYLSFANCSINELPSSIGDLQYLQTLDLNVSIYLGAVVIPNVLWKMKRVRHLNLPKYCSTKDGQKLRLDGLTELETLGNFDTGVCEVNDLVESRNLRVLEAFVGRNVGDPGFSFNLESIRNLKILRSISGYLNLAPSHLRKSSLLIETCNFDSEEGISILGELFRCTALHSLRIGGRIVKLPVCDHQHLYSSLTRIMLWNSEMEEDPMATLEKLPNLRVLSLFNESYVGTEMVCSARGLPQLRELRLDLLPNLEKWHVEKGAMPNLFSLQISSCKKLKMVPEGLRFLSGLKEITILRMKDDFLDRVRVVDGKEGEDFYKVRHVPSITIIDRIKEISIGLRFLSA